MTEKVESCVPYLVWRREMSSEDNLMEGIERNQEGQEMDMT